MERVYQLEDSSDDERREETAACKALQNRIIMYNIMKRLDFDDLKTCRAVNLIWNYISSDIMGTLDCCRVQLSYNDRVGEFFKLDKQDPSNEKARPEEQNISHLCEILDNSINFPSTDFVIQSPRYSELRAEGSQLVKFFKSHGHKMRTLTIQNIRANYELYITLLCQIPNIENLNLLSNHTPYGIRDKLCFSKLKRFTWDNQNILVSDILSNSPNLEVIESKNMHMQLDHVVNAGKSYAIKNLVCDRRTPAGMMSFIQANPQIEELTFRSYTNSSRHAFDLIDEEQQNLTATSQLLIQASSQTLKQLDICTMPATQRISLPKLPNLTRFAIGNNFRETCFPTGTNLLETFPNLHTLDLSVLSRSKRKRGNLQSCFPAPPTLIGNLPTVRVLEISSTDLSLSFMRRLHTNLCPNFKKLVIQDNKEILKLRNLPLTLEKVFKVWNHLTSIEIKEVIFGSADLDSVLTGISDDEVKTLYEGACGQVATTFCPPKKSSIVFLKALKFLTFTFCPSQDFKSGSAPLMEKPFIFSHVACSHAFNLMPELDVRIIWDYESEMIHGSETDIKTIAPNLVFLKKKREKV